MGSDCSCVVPQSLFGKRVSVKRHAVKTQRMSELDEHQNTFVFVIHEKKFGHIFTNWTFDTHTHEKTYTMENRRTLLMRHSTTDDKYKTRAIFESIVSFLRHTAKPVRENKHVPCLFYVLRCIACTVCGQNNGNTLIKTSHGNECLK